MLNHIRTLLLNKSSSFQSEWYVEPSFNPIKLAKDLLNFSNILFSDSDRIKVVESVIPFCLDPELNDIVQGLDTRVTVDDSKISHSSVADFYKSLSDSKNNLILNCITSPTTISLFNYSNNDTDFFIKSIKKLKQIYTRSKETSKRFSASILAYVLNLDRAYNKSIQK